MTYIKVLTSACYNYSSLAYPRGKPRGDFKLKLMYFEDLSPPFTAGHPPVCCPRRCELRRAPASSGLPSACGYWKTRRCGRVTWYLWVLAQPCLVSMWDNDVTRPVFVLAAQHLSKPVLNSRLALFTSEKTLGHGPCLSSGSLRMRLGL